MKKRALFGIVAAALCCMGLSSCIGIFDDDYTSSNTPAIRYLRNHYSGSFSNTRKISVADRYEGTYYEYDYDFYKVYSSELRKDVIVRCEKSKYYSGDYSYFSSNYLFLKYQDELQDYVKDYVEYTFDNSKVFIDAEWLFSDMYEKSTNLSNLKKDMDNIPLCIMAKMTTEESKTGAKNLTDNLSVKLYNNSFYGYKEVYVMSSTSSYSLNNIYSIDDLYNYGYRKFDYTYTINRNSKTVTRKY